MKKRFSLLCAILITLGLCACAAAFDRDPSTPQEALSSDVTVSEPTTLATTVATEPAATTESTMALDGSLFPMEFVFSSGAGGWGTVLYLDSSYSFIGNFHDSEMGDLSDEYPNGTVYVCVFSGKFGNITQIDAYSYAMEMAEIELTYTPGDIWIQDGTRFIASDPYGLEGTEYILYLPETPVQQFSDEILSWWPYRYESPETLSCFGIVNQTNCHGFFTDN